MSETPGEDTVAGPVGFLSVVEPGPAAQAIFDDNIEGLGYVMNVSRLWAYQPETFNGLFEVLRQATAPHRLTLRERTVLVAASVSTMRDSSCSLVWGGKLAGETDARTAAGVLAGDDDGLTDTERAMAAWARKVARDPNGTTAADVQALRDAGLSDAMIFAITVFVSWRIAFATVNDALGLLPDVQLRSTLPTEVLEAVTFGRPFPD